MSHPGSHNHSSPNAGPSHSRRHPSTDDYGAYLGSANGYVDRNGSGGSYFAGRFDDASEDDQTPSDFHDAMSSFDPPPPRDLIATQPVAQFTPPRIPASTSTLSLSAEKRLPSSLSGTLRGNRAPAPAALDLSPRSEAVRAEEQPRRVSRPLPQPPRPSDRPAQIKGAPPTSYSSSMNPPPPLSAVGRTMGEPMMPKPLDEPKANVDSVYLTATPSEPFLSPHMPQALSFSPGSPETIDPSNIDRNALIGVGELSTPRWTAANLRKSSSSSFVPPVPPSDWSQGQSGFGLGVGVMHGVKEESPQRLRPSKDDTLLSLNTLADFDFVSTMTAALAASLSVPDEPPPTPPAVNRDYRASAPAPRGMHNTSWAEPPNLSPGSARARIYARRASRLAAADANAVPPEPPVRTSSKQTPPNSADVNARRDNRRTPPQSTPKSKASPNTTHHDILKHFAPKDFSHLPPSPSSASINQFLRGSGSMNNFASIGSPPPSTSQITQSSSSRSVHRSNSEKAVDPDTDEALRKLDGLSSTPGKRTPRAKPSTSATSISSRPGTPAGKGKLGATSTEKSKPSSVHDSPLSNWVDLAEEVPVVPGRGRLAKPPEIVAKRESSSSTSFIGTPTSRDSVSQPTPSTTPSSSGKDKTARRASAGSDVSAHSGDEPVTVPPVPPLPKNYSTMKLSTAAADSPEVQSPSSIPSETAHPPRQMSKKWSFSSALNLRLHKETSPANSPGLPEETRSPRSPWSELNHPSPDEGSAASTTPVGSSSLSAPVPKPPSQQKRTTPSSIPFFRRTSSSSIQKPESAPPSMLPPPNARTSSNGSVRKSMLGMSIPSMLRGNSKRTVSQQVEPPAPSPATVEINAEPTHFASTGWNGRKRGKTLSISGDIAPKLSAPPPITESRATGSGSSSQRSSMQSSRSGSTAHPSSTLPAIQGSPALRQPSSSSSLRENNPPSATPTRIPRIARPTESPAANMGPPPAPLSKGATLSSRNTSASISEFGSFGGTFATPRQATSGDHRARLLAPMSARTEGRRPEKHHEPLVRLVGGQVVPPSRRHVAMAPSITAPTASSIAKRSSKEFRSGARVGSGSGQNTPSENPSPIKPSKSLHTKLSVPTQSRIPTSSSVGASSSRKTSLVVDSPSGSPAEDDETQADAEMAAYVKRRQARHASGKQEDLSDINGFPQDIAPSQPISQREFITRRLAKMSDYERKEVLDFDRVYYSPPSRISRPTGENGAIYNHGYDDERGDYLVVNGDHLCYRYEVAGILGKGSFGQVVQCRDHKTGGSVAIKIIRNKKRFHTQALVEVKILGQLVEWDPEDRHYMVRMTDHFYFRGHLCIVTEMLSINLYELIKANQFSGFSTIVIRRFTSQMLSSLQLMRSHRIVHCDLKPENILLCHPAKSGIKVIDFGSSCHETEKVYTYIQSRFYRSPEVILGMNYAMAIDMWSLGCILAELYTGVPIFPGENEHEQLACIMEVLGVPDRYIVDRASRRKQFFDATGAPRPFVNAKGKRRRPAAKTLAQALKCNDELFVDFISKCLTWDPEKRLKPQPALRHPWILAGRRRQAPVAPMSMVPSSSTLRQSSGSSSRNTSSNPPTHSNSAAGKSSYMISPPTPLMARTSNQSSVPASAPRFGGHHPTREGNLSSTSSRMSRPTFPSPQKVSLG